MTGSLFDKKFEIFFSAHFNIFQDGVIRRLWETEIENKKSFKNDLYNLSKLHVIAVETSDRAEFRDDAEKAKQAFIAKYKQYFNWQGNGIEALVEKHCHDVYDAWMRAKKLEQEISSFTSSILTHFAERQPKNDNAEELALDLSNLVVAKAAMTTHEYALENTPKDDPFFIIGAAVQNGLSMTFGDQVDDFTKKYQQGGDESLMLELRQYIQLVEKKAKNQLNEK